MTVALLELLRLAGDLALEALAPLAQLFVGLGKPLLRLGQLAGRRQRAATRLAYARAHRVGKTAENR